MGVGSMWGEGGDGRGEGAGSEVRRNVHSTIKH